MENILQFHNKKFKIMLVGDPHCSPRDESERDESILKDYLALQYAALRREKPDMVVLLGDNANGETPQELQKAILRCTKPYEDLQIPFSFILGNHDLESAVSDIPSHYAYYSALPHCLLPAEYTEYGDYRLTVMNTAGTAPALSLLHVYSGSRGDDRDYSYYAHVKPEQNRWIKETCEETSRAYGPVPAVLFQHIPMPEEFELVRESGAMCMLADGVLGQNEEKGKFYRIRKTTEGYLGEAPCVPAVNSGEFEAVKQTNTVFAAFYGHDHMNDFIGSVDGVIMGQSKLASFNAYGDGLRQGVRILEFHEDDPFHLKTRMVYYRDLIGTDCRSIHGTLKVFHDRQSVKLETSAKVLGVLSALILPPVLLAKLLRK